MNIVTVSALAESELFEENLFCRAFFIFFDMCKMYRNSAGAPPR